MNSFTICKTILVLSMHLIVYLSGAVECFSDVASYTEPLVSMAWAEKRPLMRLRFTRITRILLPTATASLAVQLTTLLNVVSRSPVCWWGLVGCEWDLLIVKEHRPVNNSLVFL